MVFLWFSHFPRVFPWFSHGFRLRGRSRAETDLLQFAVQMQQAKENKAELLIQSLATSSVFKRGR